MERPLRMGSEASLELAERQNLLAVLGRVAGAVSAQARTETFEWAARVQGEDESEASEEFVAWLDQAVPSMLREYETPARELAA